MATAGKIPFFGFKALIRNVVWLGFGAASVAGHNPEPDVTIQVRADVGTIHAQADVGVISVRADALTVQV